MRIRSSNKFLPLVALAVLAIGFSVWAKPKGQKNVGGSYNAIVAGDFTGAGTITTSNGNGKLSISLNVTDATRASGKLNAQLEVTNNQFSGVGDVMGRPMRIEGRLDPQDDTEQQQLKGMRLVATFGDDQGRHGRIVGSPNLAGGKGKGKSGGEGGDESDDDD